MRLPLPERRPYPAGAWWPDLMAAVALIFLAVPQGLAYATIAGLPPVMGLYAATLPVIVGSLLRSSRHVVSGPTNAVSLLVGSAGAGIVGTATGDAAAAAVTLALLVGLMQVGAGALRLGAVVDFISGPVVLGYITGAGLLIGIGQLHNVTGTSGPSGRIWVTLGGWLEQLPRTDPLAVAMALGTVMVVVGVRYLGRALERRLPAAIIALVLAMVLNLALGLEARGLVVVSDLSPVPSGLPPLTLPSLEHAAALMPLAVACTVLSLTESTAVARSIAARSGQRLDASTEFVGQGLANVAAAFTGGYPVSGSLSRSALNERAGARTRVAGILSGLFMLGVLIAFGPFLDHSPVASLAGLLLVVAYDLVDVARIRKVLRTRMSDAAAFGATMLGTWVLDLDKAIYLGMALSLVAYLRKARRLVVDELIPDEQGTLRQVRRQAFAARRDEASAADDSGSESSPCPAIRILHVEGALFFGAAGELQAALDDVLLDEAAKAVILRLRRARDLDVTTADVILAAARVLESRGRHLLLAGVGPDDGGVLERSGVVAAVGEDQVFRARAHFFGSLNEARARALELVAPDCEGCPHRLAPHGDERHGPPRRVVHKGP